MYPQLQCSAMYGPVWCVTTLDRIGCNISKIYCTEFYRPGRYIITKFYCILQYCICIVILGVSTMFGCFIFVSILISAKLLKLYPDFFRNGFDLFWHPLTLDLEFDLVQNAFSHYNIIMGWWAYLSFITSTFQRQWWKSNQCTIFPINIIFTQFLSVTILIFVSHCT